MGEAADSPLAESTVSQETWLFSGEYALRRASRRRFTMSAKAQAQKEALIAGLVEIRRKILETAVSLSPTQQDEIFLGVWSVKDLLAHLIGWDFTNLEAAKAILSGQLPVFYDHYDKNWQSYNARLVIRYKQENFTELLTAVADAHRQLIDFLATIPGQEFDKDRGIRFRGYKLTITRLLQAEMEDEKVHHGQIKRFKHENHQHDSLSTA
jgi:hypothetical protein